MPHKAIPGVVALVAFAIVWPLDVRRMDNCSRSGKQGCTVLPWSGHYAKAQAGDGELDWSKVQLPDYSHIRITGP